MDSKERLVDKKDGVLQTSPTGRVMKRRDWVSGGAGLAGDDQSSPEERRAGRENPYRPEHNHTHPGQV